MPTDAFGNEISNRTNVLDLAAHYPYSPERWRLFSNGSRIFPEYQSNIGDTSGSSSATTTDPGAFLLSTGSLTPTGKQFQKGASAQGSNEKRNLPRDDIAVVLSKSGTTGDVTYATDWEEDW